MVRNIFHQQRATYLAAWLALFAILLILVAPLISLSLQKPADMMPGMQHEMSMPMHEHAISLHHEMPQESQPTDQAQACGYCVLLAHVPGLIFLVVLLLVGRILRIRISPVCQKNRHWNFLPGLWPDTRAPPQFCFS